jgi:hypothetical protein
MDNQSVILIVLMIVSIISTLFSNGLLTVQLFMKSFKRSTCCGNSSIEMKDKTPPNSEMDLTKMKEPDFSIIIDKIRKSADVTK